MIRSKALFKSIALLLVLLVVFSTSMGISILVAGVVGEFAGKTGFWVTATATMLATMLLLGKFVLQPFYAIAAMEGVSAEKGRLILIAYCTLILLLAIAHVVVSALHGAEVLGLLGVPVFAVAAFFWLFRGSKGAKWLIVVGGVLLGGFLAVLAAGFFLRGILMGGLLPGGIAVAFLSLAVVVVTSRSVNALLESRREQTNVA